MQDLFNDFKNQPFLEKKRINIDFLESEHVNMVVIRSLSLNLLKMLKDT